MYIVVIRIFIKRVLIQGSAPFLWDKEENEKVIECYV